VIHHGVRAPTRLASGKENLILYVGAIQRRKNIARLVKAFEAVPDSWRLILAGATDGFGASDELRAIEESPARSRIEVPGYVSADQLDSLFCRARIFAFPSLDEGFGMPILQAMARAAAVMTSNCSAMPEVAGDAALLVDPLNIGDALLRLAIDASLRDGLVRRGIERVRQFTWESAVEKTWAVYDELR
jgi:glycosyltransferase involved in cell wall biosynthesis